MTTATFETSIARGLAQALKHVFVNVEELSTKDVQTAIEVCNFIQNLFKRVHVSIESGLGQGVEARAFTAEYEKVVAELDEIHGIVSQVLAKVRTSRLPELGSEMIFRYEDLGKDLTSLRQFLQSALAKATAPSRPIDWQRVRENEEAYARAEKGT